MENAKIIGLEEPEDIYYSKIIIKTNKYNIILEADDTMNIEIPNFYKFVDKNIYNIEGIVSVNYQKQPKIKNSYLKTKSSANFKIKIQDFEDLIINFYNTNTKYWTYNFEVYVITENLDLAEEIKNFRENISL